MERSFRESSVILTPFPPTLYNSRRDDRGRLDSRTRFVFYVSNHARRAHAVFPSSACACAIRNGDEAQCVLERRAKSPAHSKATGGLIPSHGCQSMRGTGRGRSGQPSGQAGVKLVEACRAQTNAAFSGRRGGMP